MSQPDLITVVDLNDNVIGSEDRQIVRQKGLVHRTVKVIIFNPAGEILLQQRSASKEDSPLKWDLSATGHVDAGEDYADAAHRETAEEVGIKNVAITWIGKYYYERDKDKLVLRRFNGIYTGHTSHPAVFDPIEVAQIKWINPNELLEWIANHPTDFTTSLREIFDRFGAQVLGK